MYARVLIFIFNLIAAELGAGRHIALRAVFLGDVAAFGFDNISDALNLSPELLENYMDAYSIKQSIGPMFAMWSKYLGDQWSVGNWSGMAAAEHAATDRDGRTVRRPRRTRRAGG